MAGNKSSAAAAFERSKDAVRASLGAGAGPTAWPESVVRALAAYCCLDSGGSYAAAQYLMRDYLKKGCPARAALTPVPLLAPDADPDADGYGASGEWGYVSLYETGLDALAVAFAAAVFDGAVPPEGFAPETVETVKVTIEVIGQGNTFPPVGTHRFAKHAPDGSGVFNTITLTAEPHKDWAFKRWWGHREAGPESLSLILSKDHSIQVEFAQLTETESLSLV